MFAIGHDVAVCDMAMAIDAVALAHLNEIKE